MGDIVGSQVESPISTRTAILQALAVESGYGSEIMGRLHESTQHKLVLHSGSVYPALRALEDEGFIKQRKVVGQGGEGEGHGRACFFELTRKGRQVVLEHRQIVLAVFFPGNVLEDLKCPSYLSTSTAS